MNKFITLSASSTILSSLLLITGCGGGGGGGGGGPAAVPKDAIALDAANTETVVAKAFNASQIILAKGTSTSTTPTGIVSQIISQSINNAKNSGIDLVSGVAFDYSVSCADGFTTVPVGTANSSHDQGNFTVSSDGATFTGSGTVTMYDCLTFGTTLDGSVTFNMTENDSTGEYSSQVTGNLSMTLPLGSPIAITNLALNETGNFYTDDYVISKMQYTYNPGTGGFAVNMTTNMEGNYLACQPTAGVVEISGASGSSIRITYSATGVLIEVDTGNGTYAEVTSTYFSCV